MHARLYYQSTGEISPADLLDGKQHALWNTIIGEGEARRPSAAIFVFVDLVGPWNHHWQGKLRLTAEDGEHTLLNQTIELDFWVQDAGKLVLPFLICGTGCKELELTATLEGLSTDQVDISTLTKTIPFECGE